MAARHALLAALLLSLAGCHAPVASPADTGGTATVEPTAEPRTAVATATPGNGSAVAVEGGRLAADPDRVFRRVTVQLGVDVQPPDTIRVVDPTDAESGIRPPRTLQVLGAQEPATGFGLAGQTIGTDLIRLNRSVATGPRVEGVLAHEFAHVVQNRRNVTGRMFASPGWDDLPYGVERRLLIRSVKEGAATYAADRYQRRYTDARRQGERMRRGYRTQETAAGRYFVAPYRFGYRYVAGRVADPGALSGVYDRPPRTTEALLHGYAPGAEPPANLSVTATGDRWRPGDYHRVGELGTRIALSATLTTSRAAAGADGWGNDLRVPFLRDGERGHVWVLRWDDAANESEFRAAFTESLDRRGARTEWGWRADGTAFRVRRGDARTTVVVAGPSRFVRNASVEVGRRVAVRGP